MDRQVVSTVALLSEVKEMRRREDERHEKIMVDVRTRNVNEKKARERGRKEILEAAYQIMEQDPEVDMVELAVNTKIDVQALYRNYAQRWRELNR